MSSRHKAREQAMQVLFTWDARKQTAQQSIEDFYGSLSSEEGDIRTKRDQFLEELVRGTVDHIDAIDEHITRHAEHWRLERMPAVDRNILRLAVYEMLHTDTPAAVLIDEAIELARRFSGRESVNFVNGVLDAVRRENAVAITAAAPKKPEN
jgi:transcription antitermination protein NusB